MTNPSVNSAGSRIIAGDNLAVLRRLPVASVDLVYIDPPFNTGRTQRRQSIATKRTDADDGDRTGYGGHRYRTTTLGSRAYADTFDDFLAFIEPRLREIHRLLGAHGSLYLHIDYREAHYCKILLDEIFGRANFINEIIWAYDYGARPTRRWPAKHDTILFYAKDAARYIFNTDEVEREPYMAPGLVGPDKAARGKLPTDVWWHTIVSPTGREKTGYPTQKPLGILRRIIAASSRPGDLVLDCFAGSGTTGIAANELGRRFLLVDDNPDALDVMAARFANIPDVSFESFAASRNPAPD